MVRMSYQNGKPSTREMGYEVMPCECGHKPWAHCYNEPGIKEGVSEETPVFEVFCRHCCNHGYQAYTGIFCTLEEAVRDWNLLAEDWSG